MSTRPLTLIPALLLLLAGGAAGCDPAPTEEEPPPDAEPALVLDGDGGGFRPLGSPVTFRLENAPAGATLDGVMAFLNGELLPESAVVVEADTVTVIATAEGENAIEIYATDTSEDALAAEARVFAGSQTLSVRVIDASGAEVAAEVRASLVEASAVFEDGAFAVGQGLAFDDVPARTIVLTAQTADGALGTLGIVGGGEAVIEVRPALPPSEVDNNDFHDGLAGWTSYAAGAAVVGHDEDADGQVPFAGDMDLMVPTAGLLGAQTVSRSFVPAPGTREVTVRYRFVTSELPNGFFGSSYNDYYAVSVRSGGASVHDTNSMNGLGLSAFDPAGATGWRETKLAVEEGTPVQIDVSVANVADALYDSTVYVDVVGERTVAIERAELHDIDGSKLTMLSASPHGYFGGETRIWGTISVRGDAEDRLEDVKLEIVQGSGVVFGSLSPSAKAALLQSFGADQTIAIEASGPLFVIDSAALSGFDTSKDGTLGMRIRVRAASGEESVFEAGRAQILKLYSGTQRYSVRDEEQGGDDWVLPSVEGVLLQSGVTVGDVSNMNGGHFVDHESHQRGVDADLRLAGCEARDAACAETLLQHLESPYGHRIAAVGVTYQKKKGDPFFDAIHRKTVRGRPASALLRPGPGHVDHLHWRISPE